MQINKDSLHYWIVNRFGDEPPTTLCRYMTTLLFNSFFLALIYVTVACAIWGLFVTGSLIGIALYNGFPVMELIPVMSPNIPNLPGPLFVPWFLFHIFMSAALMAGGVVLVAIIFIGIPYFYTQEALKPIPKGHEPSLLQQWIRDIHAKTCTRVKYK